MNREEIEKIKIVGGKYYYPLELVPDKGHKTISCNGCVGMSNHKLCRVLDCKDTEIWRE